MAFAHEKQKIKNLRSSVKSADNAKKGNMKKKLLIIGLLITQILSATEETGTLYLNKINWGMHLSEP